MSYDTEDNSPFHPLPPVTMPPMDERDLEAIVILLECAAIELTPSSGATFTRDALVSTARDIAGPEIDLHDVDVNIVLRTLKSLRRLPGGLYQLR